jgi:predicted nuclease of predicted toxin-antitoxin system
LNGFLFDENLPRGLTFTPSLSTTHSTSLGISPSDTALCTYGREHSLAIVTKDADFSARIMFGSPPPWIVHLRIGNLRLATYDRALAKLWPSVEALSPAHKLVCVYEDRIESFSG